MTTLIELIAANNTEEALKLIPTLTVAELNKRFDFGSDDQVDLDDEQSEFMKDLILITPLHYAALLGLDQIVKSLIEHGADVRARNKTNRTPMHYAVLLCAAAESQAKLNCIHYLHLAEAYLRFDIDDFGNTPLHLAAMYDQYTWVKYLLDVGSSTRDKNIEGKTPLEMAPSTATDVKHLLRSRDNTLQTVILRKLKETIKYPKDQAVAATLWDQFLKTAPEHLITQYVELDEASPRLAVICFNRAREAERKRNVETNTEITAKQAPQEEPKPDPINEIMNSFTILTI